MLGTKSFSRTLANIRGMKTEMDTQTASIYNGWDNRFDRIDRAFRDAYDESLYDTGYRWIYEMIEKASNWDEIHDLLTDANFHSVVARLRMAPGNPLRWSPAEHNTEHVKLHDGVYKFVYWGYDIDGAYRQVRDLGIIVKDNIIAIDETLANLLPAVLEVHNCERDALCKVFVERLTWNGREFEITIGS